MTAAAIEIKYLKIVVDTIAVLCYYFVTQVARKSAAQWQSKFAPGFLGS